MTPLAELLWWMLIWTVVSVLISPLMGKVMDDGDERGAGVVGDTAPARATMNTADERTRRIA